MIRKDIFKEIIREFHTRKLPETIHRDIVLPQKSNKIISVVGPRRAGKTYLLFQHINELVQNKVPFEKILYINFEDERLEFNPIQLDVIFQAYGELYPKTDLSDVHLFFDEIQNLPNWEKFSRRVYDTLTRHIYLTGSNSKLFGKDIASALRGRTLKYVTLPLSFKEFLRFKKVSCEMPADLYSPQKRVLLINSFEEFMLYGGFPEISLLPENLKIKTLQEYFDVMLYRDLIERYEIKDSVVLKYFMKRLIDNATKIVSVNKIFNELKSAAYKVSKDTLYWYMNCLEDAFALKLIRKHYKSLQKRELGEKKIYPIDNGYINALQYSQKEHRGILLENVVLHELSLRYNNICYFKENNEIDFVVFDGNKPILIQVSYSLHDKLTYDREIKGLLNACNYFKVKKGYIITMDESDERKENNIAITILPAYKFLLTELD